MSKGQSLKLPSCTTSLCRLEEFMREIAVKHSIHEEKFPDILISLTEAVNNAIIHGNKSDQNKHVRVLLTETKTGLSFRVSDEGCGFNHKTIPDPTLAENIECCGGRGVFLMKELSDDIAFLNEGRTVEMHFSV
ncbi:MAG: serine/threonine-protein kinase RsbW [Saprospiraceae bacterium]|jgi:serine/threonine-protein kinase RsbW